MKNTFYESERDSKNKVTHILLYNTECDMHFHNATEILFVKKGHVHLICTPKVGQTFGGAYFYGKKRK